MNYDLKDFDRLNAHKSRCVAFTGYRTAKMLRAANYVSISLIEDKCYETVKMLYNNDYDTFLSGAAEGFDLIAAKAVIRLRDEGADVRLIMVVPFIGQEARYDAENKELYRSICNAADGVVTLFEKFEHDYQFLRRNDCLIEHSACLICFYDGQRGGTMYTVNKAEKVGMPIFNIANT